MRNLHIPYECGIVHVVSFYLVCAPCHLSDCDRYFAFIILYYLLNQQNHLLVPHNATGKRKN